MEMNRWKADCVVDEGVLQGTREFERQGARI